MMTRHFLLVICTLTVCPSTWAANASVGRILFRQQCALCHSAESADNGRAEGPNLKGVLGRKAASDSDYNYSAALKSSGLTWDAATLNHFLSSPTSVVPGTAMVVAVPGAEDRDNLITYFRGIANGAFKETPRPQQPQPSSGTGPRAPEGIADWRNDAPGRAHRIELAKLPEPHSTSSATNFPKLIGKPPDAHLSVPRGFKVNVFASDVQAPRAMRLAPNELATSWYECA
jgi:cytochrome c2